uniref:Uncharacterized protein n=1 Tax=Romanomermis culicivorax TaxID=13658 RepID=A0A915L7Q8_ROMCU
MAAERGSLGLGCIVQQKIRTVRKKLQLPAEKNPPDTEKTPTSSNPNKEAMVELGTDNFNKP